MPPTRGARCVLRTSPWDHPASALAAGFVEARPLLRAVHLLVPVEAGDDALTPAPTPLPPPPPYAAVDATLADLVTPAFAAWASADSPGATGLALAGALDGGGALALSPGAVLSIALPGDDWRRLGLNGVKDPDGEGACVGWWWKREGARAFRAGPLHPLLHPPHLTSSSDCYMIHLHLTSKRAGRDPAPLLAARATLARAAPARVPLAFLPPGWVGGGGALPPLEGAAEMAPETGAVRLVAASSPDFVAAFGCGPADADPAAPSPIDADDVRDALEWLGAAAAGLEGALAGRDDPPTCVDRFSATGLVSPAHATAALAAARSAVAGGAPWAGVVGVPFSDAPLAPAAGRGRPPAAGAAADRAAAWCVVALPGDAYALLAAGGGGDGLDRV